MLGYAPQRRAHHNEYFAVYSLSRQQFELHIPNYFITLSDRNAVCIFTSRLLFTVINRWLSCADIYISAQVIEFFHRTTKIIMASWLP